MRFNLSGEYSRPNNLYISFFYPNASINYYQINKSGFDKEMYSYFIYCVDEFYGKKPNTGILSIEGNLSL